MRSSALDVEFWDAHFSAVDVEAAPTPQIVVLGRALPRQSLVLDVGCGYGANAIPLAQLGHRVDALDFSAEALRRARELAERYDVASQVRTIQADMTTYAFPRSRYDLVAAVGALQNAVTSSRTTALERVIARLQAATRRGGRNYLLITADVRSLVLPRGTSNAMNTGEMRDTWTRLAGRSKPIGALGRSAAVRVMMAAYADPAWDVELLVVPPPDKFQLFAFGTNEIRRAYWLEVVAVRRASESRAQR